MENTTGNPFPTPGTGKVIRINCNGSRETIASGLSLPTGITFGPDGNLYVSNIGFGPMSIGGGRYLKLKLNIANAMMIHQKTIQRNKRLMTKFRMFNT